MNNSLLTPLHWYTFRCWICCCFLCAHSASSLLSLRLLLSSLLTPLCLCLPNICPIFNHPPVCLQLSISYSLHVCYQSLMTQLSSLKLTVEHTQLEKQHWEERWRSAQVPFLSPRPASLVAYFFFSPLIWPSLSYQSAFLFSLTFMLWYVFKLS